MNARVPRRDIGRSLVRSLPALLAATLVVLLPPAPAWAETAGSIDHVETKAGELRLLYSLPGLASDVDPDLSSLGFTINGESVEAVAAPAAAAGSTKAVRRTTIMTIDVSNSMQGERFEQAKQAAQAFLDAAPADVLVGIVTFADDVTTVAEPTLDREQLGAELANLTLSPQTRLYDGVVGSIDALGDVGQRSLLVLSDGKDTSETPVADVTSAIKAAEIKVDVVALEQAPEAREPLQAMATAGEGALLTADDPQALVQLFSDEADNLAGQLLVTAAVPDDLSGTEGTVAVSIDAAGESFTDTAFVTLTRAAAPSPTNNAPQKVVSSGFQVSTTLMWVGLGAAGVGVLLVLLIAMGVFRREKKESLEDRVAAYSRTGDPRGATARGTKKPTSGGPSKGVTGSAVGVAEKALASNRGLEVRLGGKLDAAGMSLKPAEWLLLHAGIAVSAAVLAFLLSSGSPVVTLILLGAGAVVPWIYLGIKKGRRLKAFNTNLAETLQLISGGLSAGLSLAQAVDTVVREGTEPIAGEFRRALVEARLGVQVEDALESVSQRMESEDFEWIVMAIRIQRQVGGNLAELLLKVAATMREREYLRRQVKSLSAEGRLSAWIIGGLPPAFIVYLLVVNPDYLKPLVQTTLGWIMIGGMCLLMSVGGFWMSRVVKVEV